MEISLVIPAYNEEKYLAQCLETALKYGAGRFKEIVVVDNASTDRTAEIAHTFAGVQVVREGRKGTNFAREAGFLATTAPLLAFIDADTLLRPGWVEKVEHAFARDPMLACLTGPYWYYDLPYWEAMVMWLSWHFSYIGNFLTHSMGVGGNMVLRREALERMGGFDTSFTFDGDDINTARRASRFGRVRFTFSIILDSSGRRYKTFGFIRIWLFYLRNTTAGMLRIKVDESVQSREAR